MEKKQHAAPAKLKIRKGDLVLLDLWAKLDQPGSVYYDITWTHFCGETVVDAVADRLVAYAADRARAGHGRVTSRAVVRTLAPAKVRTTARLVTRK